MQVFEKIFSKLAKFEFKNNHLDMKIKNKNAQLFFDGRQITKDIGLHTSCLCDGKWYSSQQGLWRINLQEDVCNITIDWEKIPLRQIWKITRTKSGYDWVVYLDVKDDVNIDRLVAGAVLSDEYEKWFSVREKGVFPDFSQDWANIYLKRPNDKVFGLEPAGALPGCVFENLAGGELLLQNSPESDQGRVLRVELGWQENGQEKKRYKIFHSKISFLGQSEGFEAGKQQAIDDFLAGKELIDGKTRIYFDDNTVQLFWNNSLISRAQGLHSALYVNGQWLDSSRYKWHLQRINERCMYVTIDYEDYPIQQFWQISLLDETSFVWKVKTRLKEKRDDLVEKQTIGMAFSGEYEKWFGAYESGDFPKQAEGWKMMIADGPAGTVGVKKNGLLPAICFKNKQGYNAGLIVQNLGADDNIRYLQAEKADLGKDDSGFDFVQEITIQESDERIEANLSKRIEQVIMSRGIENGDLKLLADNARLRIFWADKEITTDIGLHTAVLSQGKWYDSGKMSWLVEKPGPRQLKITVDFKPFPVTHNWQLELDEQNMISWQVMMEVKKPVEIQEHKTGLIIKSDYKSWFNAFETGKFPDDFGFWDDMIRNRDGETFGVYPDNGLPGILFSVDDDHLSLIQNTDENIKGRVLQGQVVEANETKQYQQGKREFFRGKIKITKDIKDIENYRKDAQPLLVEPEYIYFYGNNAKLHARIAGVDDFEQKTAKIRQLSAGAEKARIIIGVSRYNFFMLDEIVAFAAKLQNKKADLRTVKLNIFPLRRLRRNFIEYLDQLKAIARELGDIKLVLVDDQLFELLTKVCAQSGVDNERQLLRLLGVICEHAFIGPQIVVMDPHHRCNANCVHCWVHTPGVHHDKEFYETHLSLDEFKPIADDLSELMTDLIIFQGDGEPLMYPKFFDMLEYAVAKNLQVSFFTNGILLDEAKAAKAIELGVNEIFCSLPAGTPETFGKINTMQKPEVFNTILKNLKKLSELKKKLGKNKPRLILTHVIHSWNAHELYEMAKNDIAIGADVMRFYLIRLDENIKFLKLEPEDINAVKTALPKIKQLIKGKDIELLDTTEFQLENFEEKSGNWSQDVFLEKGCTLGWNFSLIPAGGNISFCCHLRTVGYLKDKTFKQIWNSEEYRNFRHQAKYLNKYKQEKFLNGTTLWDSHCQQCDTHQVIRDVWDQFTLYKLEKYFI